MKWINIWSERVYPPFLMTAAAKGTVFNFKRVFPDSKIKIGGNYWINGLNSYFYPNKQFCETADFLYKKTIKSPEFFYSVLKKALDKSIKLKDFSEKYKEVNLRRIESKELIKHLKLFDEKFCEMYGYDTVPVLLGCRQDNPIYKRIDKILRAKIKNEPERFAGYLVTLTKPLKLLKPQIHELEVLKLARKAKRLGFKTKKDIMKHLSKGLNLIKQKFRPLSFDLLDNIIWDDNHYSKLISEKMNININEEINEIENYGKNTKRDFNNLCKKLSLSVKEREAFEIVRDLGYYKWIREYEFQEALYNLKFVQNELGKRCKLSTLESKYLLADEFQEAIKNPKKFQKMAKQRYKNSLILVDKNKGVIIFTGNKAKQKYLKMGFIEGESKPETNGIKGTPAFLGKVSGVVRIINTVKDIKKMRKGDILVSQATNPELISAIKKASAIVTNEGGITCHAAIVSRELKIPCIVGTKIATKILKDGDKVEVNANKGIVKKL